MSLTELVLMPGEDYQQICDNLRSALDTSAPITSQAAAEMTGEILTEWNSAKDALAQAREAEDALIAKTALNGYYNDRVRYISQSAFEALDMLSEEVVFPNVTEIADSAFGSCIRMEKAKFPKNERLGYGVFFNCKALKFLDLGYTEAIQSGAITSASALQEIVLRKADSPVALTDYGAFNGTPFYSSGTGGKIYVPQALIEQYKTATNWSALYGYGNCEFTALEGSEYE